MIAVEVDIGPDWKSWGDWGGLADEAARAAVAHSRHSRLAASALSAEISIKFTGDRDVRALNAGYRARDRATNVLSFPMIEPELLADVAGADGGEVLLGDVVLAAGVCISEAEEKGVTLEAHAAHLVVHGVLHLLGYDHGSDGDAVEMEQAEREALASIGVADPYEATEVQT